MDRWEPKITLKTTTFLQFVNSVTKNGECILWTGINRTGYGRLSLNGKQPSVHRWLYELVHGKLPRHIDLDHICRTRNCINLKHLEPVTKRENQRRGLWGELKKTCVNGHLRSRENSIYEWRTGKPPKREKIVIRRCKICREKQQRSYKHWMARFQDLPETFFAFRLVAPGPHNDRYGPADNA